ncbi:MAG TPA: ATP-binding protein [Bryobacteraceae bacterium]|nr:ATP-binding protein [Bryobacteraceae bacterium]
METGKAQWTRAGVTAAGIGIAALLHYLTPPSLLLWHNVFQRLYYLPIVYAALYFGWRGGILAAGLAAVSYIPHISMSWHHMPEYAGNQYAEIIVFFLVGSVTGALADRGQRQRRQLELTSAQLAKANRDLQDSFEQIKRADRLSAIGQLSASLAHEIRNPLGSIEGAANLLEQPGTPSEIRGKSLSIIRKEVQRLNRLLTGLLDFARPRRPALRTVDLATVLDSVIALVTHSARMGQIEIRRTVPPGLPPVECDPEQLKQVILNLSINAIQAMPEGGDLELALEPASGAVRISVRDQGEGIPASELEKIFEPFYTTKTNGTGLGLAVALQIVTQNRGTLTAEPNTPRGMRFIVTLPAGAPDVTRTDSDTRPA